MQRCLRHYTSSLMGSTITQKCAKKAAQAPWFLSENSPVAGHYLETGELTECLIFKGCKVAWTIDSPNGCER